MSFTICNLRKGGGGPDKDICFDNFGAAAAACGGSSGSRLACCNQITAHTQVLHKL